tara:strand:- start:204 stop:1211 length:1008 start_codon:yes stop_codon:yes gene_type:complete
MAAAAAPFILRGLLGARGSSGLMNLLKPPYRNPFRGPTSTRTGTKYPKGGRGRRSRTTGIPLGGKPIIKHDPGGIFYRNPMKTMYGGLTAGTGAAGLAYGLLSGDDKPAEEPTGPSAADIMRAREQAESDALAAKQPSMSASHRTAYLKKRKKRLQKGMKQLLNQYMILSAVSPEQADNFLKAGMKMMETDQEFNDDLQMQDAYDTVFQPGNMPTSGRDAFAKLLPYVGKKDAMAIAGDWSDLVPEYKEWQYKKKETMAMEDILRMPRSQGIQTLISMWLSNTFDTPENLKLIDPRSPQGQQDWVEYADAYLDMIQSGGGGATSSGQIFSDTKRS